jgi:hypothetical protein
MNFIGRALKDVREPSVHFDIGRGASYAKDMNQLGLPELIMNFEDARIRACRIVGALQDVQIDEGDTLRTGRGRPSRRIAGFIT